MPNFWRAIGQWPDGEEEYVQTLILTLHIIVCVLLVILVLLQSGKEGMGVIFGGGNTSVFGSGSRDWSLPTPKKPMPTTTTISIVSPSAQIMFRSEVFFLVGS